MCVITRVTRSFGWSCMSFSDYSLRTSLKDETIGKSERWSCEKRTRLSEVLLATKTIYNTSTYSAYRQELNTNLTAIVTNRKKQLELPIPSVKTEKLLKKHADHDFRVTSSTPPKSCRLISSFLDLILNSPTKQDSEMLLPFGEGCLFTNAKK